jgi:hypothetical protein
MNVLVKLRRSVFGPPYITPLIFDICNRVGLHDQHKLLELSKSRLRQGKVENRGDVLPVINLQGRHILLKDIQKEHREA